MNLGKLLGAGKTFFGGRGTVTYREVKHVYLPKFNSEKNPFTPKPATVEPDAQPEALKPIAVPAASGLRKSGSKSAVGPVRAVSWSDRLNPFRTPAPVAPSMVNAVQVELSLDAVKVVHNDLVDVDIEIVPVKSNTLAVPETPMLPPARQAWEFMGERLMKAR